MEKKKRRPPLHAARSSRRQEEREPEAERRGELFYVGDEGDERGPYLGTTRTSGRYRSSGR